MEQEPNNEPAKANRVAVPGAVTGRFEQKGDLDYYVFAAKKGTRYVIDGQTHDLNSPTEIYMTLRDAKNNQIQASDPMKDPRLDFTATADADYFVTVEHLHYWAGPDEVYRLTFAPYQPGFDLSLGLDRYDAAANGSFAFPILAIRRDYAGPIDVSVVGPPGLTRPGADPGRPTAAAEPAGRDADGERRPRRAGRAADVPGAGQGQHQRQGRDRVRQRPGRGESKPRRSAGPAAADVDGGRPGGDGEGAVHAVGQVRRARPRPSASRPT